MRHAYLKLQHQILRLAKALGFDLSKNSCNAEGFASVKSQEHRCTTNSINCLLTDTPSILYSLKKTRLFRRLLIKGFCFSIFFHTALFFLFQIKTLQHPDAESLPSTVYLSQIEPSVSLFSAKKTQEEDPRQKYAREYRLNSNFLQESVPLLPPASLISSTVSSPETPHIQPLLPWTFSDDYAPSSLQGRVHPIKIILHSSLRHLAFIDDGSRLFKKSSPQTLLHAPIFAQAMPKVHFDVEISPISGRIIKLTCIKEPFDKRLQEISTRILQKIQFHTDANDSKKNIWQGTITLQFYGTFETVSSLIDMDELR